MGQAKLRGTFEERKAAAQEKNAKIMAAKREILQRQASPKHTRLMAALAALSISMGANR